MCEMHMLRGLLFIRARLVRPCSCEKKHWSLRDAENMTNPGASPDPAANGQGMLSPTTLQEGVYNVRLNENNTAVIEPGEVVFSDGSRYRGAVKAGLRHGHGVLQFASGEVYTGDWRRDRRDGKGTMEFAPKHKYTGQWHADFMAGIGCETFPDGNVYEGTYEAGMMKGHGVLRYANGDRYEGQFDRDCPNGPGTLTYANGDTLTCTFVDGKRHGEGRIRYAASGKAYIVNFEQDNVAGVPTLAPS